MSAVPKVWFRCLKDFLRTRSPQQTIVANNCIIELTHTSQTTNYYVGVKDSEKTQPAGRSRWWTLDNTLCVCVYETDFGFNNIINVFSCLYLHFLHMRLYVLTLFWSIFCFISCVHCLNSLYVCVQQYFCSTKWYTVHWHKAGVGAFFLSGAISISITFLESRTKLLNTYITLASYNVLAGTASLWQSTWGHMVVMLILLTAAFPHLSQSVLGKLRQHLYTHKFFEGGFSFLAR